MAILAEQDNDNLSYYLFGSAKAGKDYMSHYLPF